MNQTDRKKICNEAARLLNQYDISKPPVPVDKLARLIGAKLKYSPLDEELSGMVFIKEGRPIIGVNATHHVNRQRFTIAHEIGHVMLHKNFITKEVHVDKTFPMLMRDSKASKGIDIIEIEANAFAAELLMPEAFLKEALENKSYDIDDDAFVESLAKKFKVSLHAIQLRLGKLLHN